MKKGMIRKIIVINGETKQPTKTNYLGAHFMNAKFYYTNGTTTTTYPSSDTLFYIEEYKQPEKTLYSYPGDDIFYDLDSTCINLYDLFRDKIFSSSDEYYHFLDFLPQGITRAGLDSDFNLPKDIFAKYFTESLLNLYPPEFLTNPELNIVINKLDNNKFRYAYLKDCQSMISTLQELIWSSQNSFVAFYKYLSEVPVRYDFKNIYCDISPEGRIVFNMSSNLIIALYSIFDILTKICFELEHLKDCSTAYPKLASSKKLFGDKKDLKCIDFEGTIFEKTNEVNIISSLRNELIHNATWEMNPKIFISIENKHLIEKFIFMPDFDDDGYLITYKNRKRFFSNGKKLNEELPSLYMTTIELIHNTISKINIIYREIENQ